MSNSPRISALRRAVQEAADILSTDAPDTANLAARTSHLARILPRDEVMVEGARQVFTFELGSGEQATRYAWPIGAVHGLLHIGHLTPIPSAPAVYRGLINWRGTVLAALDLRVYFGQVLPDTISPWVMIIGSSNPGNHLKVGVLADDVFDLTTLQATDISTLPDTGGALIAGITADKLMLLDAEQLLAREAERMLKSRTA